jgi:hypothetical protein
MVFILAVRRAILQRIELIAGYPGDILKKQRNPENAVFLDIRQFY